MQAVGVVLVSAMLIIPPATACLLTDRMHRVLILSAVIGIATAAFGAFLSFLGSNLPTGPFMVLAGSFVFAMAFLFSPQQGWLTRLWRQKTQKCRIERENTLKAMYHLAERRDFREEGITLLDLAEARREPLEQIRLQADELLRQKLATLTDDGSMLHFTPEGWRKACAVVRNHRLWELYLTNTVPTTFTTTPKRSSMSSARIPCASSNAASTSRRQIRTENPSPVPAKCMDRVNTGPPEPRDIES
jgi:manganese/zinc/iron transport system permease protein